MPPSSVCVFWACLSLKTIFYLATACDISVMECKLVCSMSLGPFTETNPNLMETFIEIDTACVELLLNIFTSGIETFVIPWVSTAEEQVVACACHAAGPSSIPGRDKFPGWGFSSPVRQMSGSFRPLRSLNIIWPSLSSILNDLRCWSALTPQIYKFIPWDQLLYPVW